jgi:hypothetical protein
MNTTAKSILICALSFSMPTYSIGQSLLEKLAIKIESPPSVVCIQDQCNYIAYSHDGENLLMAWTILHGETFFGWPEPCRGCILAEDENLAVKALENNIKSRFPDAKTGDEFDQFAY